MRELLEAGVHFGHQTRRWNPKMRRFIFTERAGIYIIDLQQTQKRVEDAFVYARNVAERGGNVLFVGTKKQTRDAIAEHASRVNMPYVNHRWLGGLLTNYRTMQSRIQRMHDLRRLRTEGQLELLPTKERMSILRELEKLETNLGGVADMRRPPAVVFVVDLKKEALAVREARRCGIPVIGLVDTNCDPDEADYVIPGNDDAIKSCALIVRALADGVAEGTSRVRAAEMKAMEAAAAEAAAAEEAAALLAAAEGGDGEPAGASEPAAAERAPARPPRASRAPEPAPEAASAPEPAPEPAPEAEPEPAPEPQPEPAPEAQPDQAPEAAAEPVAADDEPSSAPAPDDSPSDDPPPAG